MRVLFKSVLTLLIILIVTPFFNACGELDTVLPSAGTYQVNALVNDTSLDDCSLVAKGDAIRPFFASPVASDPDITGLVVFVRSSREPILGGKTLYTLKANGQADFDLPVKGAKKPESEGEIVEGAAAGPAKSLAVKADIKNTLIQVKRLDQDLPDFLLPEPLAVGEYTLVFQVLGEKEILYQTEEAVYYLGDAAFSLKEIQMYLPGISTGSRVVPPGATIMLEARLDFDSRLDPYLIWYNGKKRVSEGYLSEGAGVLLWDAPEQTGFHSLRVEALPVLSSRGIMGSSREISIPVSSKAAGDDLVSGDSPDLLHWYQFGGNLRDSKPPMPAESSLISGEGKPVLWRPAGYSYGLAAGANNAYTVPPVGFIRKGERESRGQLLLRFKPVADGNILSALFAPAEDTEEAALGMNLSLKGETLSLSLSVPGKAAEETAAAVIDRADGGYIAVAIEFTIQAGRFEARFYPDYLLSAQNAESASDDNRAVQHYEIGVRLAAPLSGEGSFILGGQNGAGITAIWDELAILQGAPAFLAAGPKPAELDGQNAVPGKDSEKGAGI
jgi:hypothetical protein